MRRKHLTFSIVFLLLCSFIALVAVSQQKSRLQLENEMDAAYDRLYNPEYGAYPIYKSAFDELESEIQSFKNNHGELQGTKLSPKLDPGSALLDGIDKNLTAKRLSDALKTQLQNIGTKQDEVAFLWLDVQAAWYAYYDAVGAYNYGLSPNEQISIKEPSKETETPLFFCAGSCDELFTTEALARVSHQVYCPEKHGTSGTTGVTYYLCSGSCDRSNEHWLVCGGSCGQKFAPKKINRGQGNYDYVADSPHYVKCSESVYSALNPNAKCGEEYYTCQNSSCPERNTHWSGSTPPPSPSYHACGVHETSVSGDHSLQASCSASNANGSCTVSGFYACDGHSHVYPSPPDPPTIVCPAHSWTGCGGTFSHEKTCGSGHTYYTCNPSAVSWHTAERTCSRTGCNATYTDCSRGSDTTKHCLGRYYYHQR